MTASISDTASTLSAEGSRGVIALLKEVEIRIQYDKTTTKESFSSVSPPAVSPRKRIAERQSPKFVRVTKQLGRKRKTPFRYTTAKQSKLLTTHILKGTVVRRKKGGRCRYAKQFYSSKPRIMNVGKTYNVVQDDHTYCRQNAG